MTILSSKMPQYFGKDLEAMSFARNYHKWIMAEFHSYLGGSVAEVGAGIGNFSKLVLEANIKNLKAFEPSQNMYPLLKETLSQDRGAEAINGFFGRADPGESFDSILYVNVLEHIEDDASELANAHKALNMNGHLLIFVPALPWLYSELDKQVGHFRRYLKQDLVSRAQQAGFTIVKARYFDLVGIIPWYFNFVLLKNSIDGNSISLYDRLVVPPMRFIEGLVAPPLGKNVLLVAKKA
ncbi:bifunctional 2-polyprenyl-6-hydroxyphenol methylase/3-demethylubiquinol 3-O-methyltransferase UbiG [Synechococcus sp. PCC 7336]|uniref:class I SAM-dependent methyltransferase n=1 Tax=Synechococcus sp. PCC 7336 TaxID=195250 RepID=UPI0003721CFD|nr:class I SAM-dependent methyltransferase [Synechococcus sp. PCC 7336]